MTAPTGSQAARHEWRLVLFRILAGLIAVGLFLVDGVGVLAPWLDPTSSGTPVYTNGIQRWYDARSGAYTGILITGSLLALLWRPHAQPLALLFLIGSGIVLAALEALFAPLQSILQVAIIALLGITYPYRAGLRRLTIRQRLSWPLVGLSLLLAVLLAIDVWRSISTELAAGGSRLLARHMVEAVALALAGLLAATRRPGWQALGLLTGVALIYLGLAAAKLPIQAGGWGAAGAALATLGGWAFVGVTAWEVRRAGKKLHRTGTVPQI
jgi:hypothetical protein